MSFSRFIYYCAAWGAWAAFVGWALGQAVVPAEDQYKPSATKVKIIRDSVQGLCLGAFLGLGLACVETVVSGGALRRPWRLVARAGTALAVGATGGWFGALLGSSLYQWRQWGVFFVFGWSLTGLLIGAAPAASDVFAAWLRGLDASGSWRKVRNGLIGGLVGGLLGSGLAFALQRLGPRLFPGRSPQELWTPIATGFVALGGCIGLAVGLAQVIFKEAWLRVEAGFRSGRQLILSRPETTIGRAESCDLGLFGDPAVERLHARILRLRGSFVLVDGGTADGTYVNDELISGPTQLSSGDQIRIGACLLSFGERSRQPVR
jgi:FHA domain-containing protein